MPCSKVKYAGPTVTWVVFLTILALIAHQTITCHSEPQPRISLSFDAYDRQKERSFVPQNDLVNWLPAHDIIG